MEKQLDPVSVFVMVVVEDEEEILVIIVIGMMIGTSIMTEGLHLDTMREVMISMKETIMGPQGIETSVIMITIGILGTGSAIDIMKTETVTNVIGTMRKETSIMTEDHHLDIMKEVMRSMREIGAMTDMSETDTSIQAVQAEDPLPLEPLLLIGEITKTTSP